MSAFHSSNLDALESTLIRDLARVQWEGVDALPKSLARLAERLTTLLEVAGSAVVAFNDQTELLAVASNGMDITLDDERLNALPVRLSSTDMCFLTAVAAGTDRGILLGFAARHKGTLAGAILLHGRGRGRIETLAKTVTTAAPWVAETVQAAKKTEAATKVQQLQDLALRGLGADQPDLALIVSCLATLFSATSCTLLLEEPANATLRLSASTDSRLGRGENGRGPVEYQRGEGLTGWVFDRGRALRLVRAGDAGAVLKATGLRRAGPRFAENDGDGVEDTQFLAVPVRTAGETFGVLRMTRPFAASRFSGDDESALQHFAGILGIALEPKWKLLVGQTIEDSEAIAIAVTHRERQEDGSFIPRLILFNPGAERMLGYKDGAALRLNAENLYAPDAYGPVQDALEAKLAQAEEAGHAEYGPVDSELLHRNGSVRSVKMSYRIFADHRFQPTEIYTIGIFRDRTDSARREAQHRRLLELLRGMGIAYFHARIDGRTLETSAAEADILGYSEADLLRLDRSEFYEDPQDRINLMMRAQTVDSGELVPVRQPLRRQGGEFINTTGYVRTVQETLDQHGQATVEGLYRDVTRRLEIQGFVDASRERVVSDDELFAKLKERDQHQHDYLSGLGHQLLTPLASLVGNLDDLHSGLLRDAAEIDDSLEWIIGQAKQCMRMVRNLSYMDKILRQETFPMGRVSMAKVCIATRNDFLHLLEEKCLRLDVDDRSLRKHLTVRGHEDLLRQVVVNLVDNAIKYSPKGSTVAIYGSTVSQGQVLQVSNEGLPIPAELRAKVFERGFRTDRAKTWVPHGTGLGLWLVRLILEAHAATASCDEIEENGRRRTCFKLVFPSPERSAIGGHDE